jgi:hypothetical protein
MHYDWMTGGFLQIFFRIIRLGWFYIDARISFWKLSTIRHHWFRAESCTLPLGMAYLAITQTYIYHRSQSLNTSQLRDNLCSSK